MYVDIDGLHVYVVLTIDGMLIIRWTIHVENEFRLHLSSSPSPKHGKTNLCCYISHVFIYREFSNCID